MTQDELKNIGMYVVWALIGATVTTGLQLAGVLSGTDEILVRPLLATFLSSFFGTIATVLGASRLTRVGSTGIAQQVDALREAGVPRREMVVVDRADIVPVPEVSR
jgi:hypothetical protein